MIIKIIKKDNQIRKSIVPIVRIVSNEEVDNVPVLKGTLRISNMIPVPDSELENATKSIIIVTHSQNVCDKADVVYELKKSSFNDN